MVKIYASMKKSQKRLTRAKRGFIAARCFDLSLSMGCGQVFGWERSGDWYYGVVDGVAIALRQIQDKVAFEAEKPISVPRIIDYLGLDHDIALILKEITLDDFMRRAVESVGNLRLFKQDPWLCLCAYILSSNNRVERIDQVYKLIARKFGTRKSVRGHSVYLWPKPERIASLNEQDLRKCGAGFRAEYLLEASRAVAQGHLDLVSLGNLPYEDARAKLMEIKGVGEKISDCVLLFAYARYESFPVDVWIKRAMEKVYFRGRSTSAHAIAEFARNYFGRYAGYAQQYIYHYARCFMREIWDLRGRGIDS